MYIFIALKGITKLRYILNKKVYAVYAWKAKNILYYILIVFVADITGSAPVQGGGQAADLKADRLTQSGLRKMIGLGHGTVSEAEERDHAAETAADHAPETEKGRGHIRS